MHIHACLSGIAQCGAHETHIHEHLTFFHLVFSSGNGSAFFIHGARRLRVVNLWDLIQLMPINSKNVELLYLLAVFQIFSMYMPCLFSCPWMFPVPIPQNDQLGYGGTSFQSSLSLGTWKFFSPIEYCHSISFLNRLRHLQIEVTSEQVGVFNISAKGVGVTMASEQLLFQELLQKQYENVDTMEIFDMCIVNVNLLIFLINKKFYHK